MQDVAILTYSECFGRVSGFASGPEAKLVRGEPDPTVRPDRLNKNDFPPL